MRGTTESINLVAATFGLQHVGPGDEIVITHLEHHANIVPWQQLALAKGAKLRVAPVDDTGTLLLDEYAKLLTNKTKLVAFTQVSNALGTVTPAKQMVEMAKRVGACVLVDGAQSVSHMKVDVQDLGADFFVFSGHKLFGPTGIGVLWGRQDLLDSLPPYQTGGNMIQDVTLERSIFHKAPNRFEAGTGNIADAVGLGAAIDYVERIGLENIGNYEHGLIVYATKQLLSNVPGIRIIGTSPEKAGVISLVSEGRAERGSWCAAQQVRHRRPVGSSLRSADPAPLRAGDDGASLVRVLQHLRRDRSPGRCAGRHPAPERAFAPLTARCVQTTKRRSHGCEAAVFIWSRVAAAALLGASDSSTSLASAIRTSA